ncbi:MAG: phosphatidylserine decarboxylase [Burkholderiales bacterium]
MEAFDAGVIGFGVALLAAGAYVYWRYVWFFRNPPRTPPAVAGLVSAADGTVVYVKRFAGHDDVIHVKQGLAARLTDIVAEDLPLPKLVIGVFMSPLDVHYNRAPLDGTVSFVRHHPGHGANVHMGPMHWRILTRRPPYYEGSTHIVRNERTVTRIDGVLRDAPLPCYVVQIAARTVAGIDSYVTPGDPVQRGAIFGMIRIGSQVDIVIPWREDLTVRVAPGERVRAGETVLVE